MLYMVYGLLSYLDMHTMFEDMKQSSEWGWGWGWAASVIKSSAMPVG